MIKEFVTVTEPEKRKIEDWVLQTYGSQNDHHQVDLSLMLLYKIHELEEKIATIEQQTKTHWAK